MRRKTNLAPVHPGEILREEFLTPMGISIHGLARHLGNSAELWIGLQQDFERDMAKDAAGERIAVEVLPRAS